MHRQTIKIELSVNGRSVTVGHQFLEDIVRSIPDIKENKTLFSELALSDNPEVREVISRNNYLNKKTIHLLLSDEDNSVVDNILSNSDLTKYITEEVLLEVIESDNTIHLKTIASNIETFSLCDTCSIAHKLSQHENPSVRYALVRWYVSDVVSTKILKLLASDSDFDVAKEAKEAKEALRSR